MTQMGDTFEHWKSELSESEASMTGMEKAMMNKKVWTKLANGLYAWRRKRVPKSNPGGNNSSNSAERVPLSAKESKRKCNDNLGFGNDVMETDDLLLIFILDR